MSEPTNLVALLAERAAADPQKNLYTFLENGERESARLSRGELLTRAQTIASRLQQDVVGGTRDCVERALLLHPPGLDLIAAFWGCLFAGVAAVPAFPPRGRRNLPRLHSIARDARPRWVLCPVASVPQVTAWVERTEGLEGVQVLGTDHLSEDLAESWQSPNLTPQSLAFLQYTSGSTAEPKGVMVSHGNLIHNLGLIADAFHQRGGPTVLGWLPLHHDMGLIGNVLQPLFSGGRAILMPPAAFLQKPSRWLRAIAHYRAHTSGGPNFAYDLCVEKITEEDLTDLDLSSWRVAFNGAEPVRASTLAAFAETFKPCGFESRAFFPCFGLAEATLLVSAGGGRDASSLLSHGPVSCGEVAEGLQAQIVDPISNVPCVPGREGEVWLAGASVAGGYWQNEEATAETFRAHLASGEGPFLRTGDLGFLAAGELFISGRLKDLIILRGRNYYPQDIEQTAAESHPDLEPRGGAAFAADGEGEERLVLVQEVRRRPQAAPQEIAAAIRREVAEAHEVQASEVVLIRTGSLPRTTSGKVRRRACAEAWQRSELPVVLASGVQGDEEAAEAFDEPLTLRREDLLSMPRGELRNVIRKWMAATVAKILRRKSATVQAGDSLAALGFDSLAVAELRHLLEDHLGTAPSWERLMSGATLEELATELGDSLRTEGTDSEVSEVVPRRPGRWVGEGDPSHGQRGLWLHSRLAPESIADHLSFVARFPGNLDRATLAQTLSRWSRQHAALGARFPEEDGTPRQLFSRDFLLESSEIDATSWNSDTLNGRLAEAVEEPFDLEEGPAVRVQLFDRGEEGDVLLFVAHHIVMDLTSLFVLLKDFAKSSETERSIAQENAYFDYVEWQKELLESATGEAHWHYWQERLDGFDPLLEWPSDRPRPALGSAHGAQVPDRLPAELVADLQSFAARANTTLYTVLLAALQVLLFRHCGQRDLVVGAPFSGRTRPQWADLVGYLVNPLPLRADFSADPTFEEFLAAVATEVVGALEHQDFPATLLVERLAPRRDPGHHPLFQAFFALENVGHHREDDLAAFVLGQDGGSARLGTFEVESMALALRSAPFDLTCRWIQSGRDEPSDLRGQWVYSADLFDSTTVLRMGNHLRSLLQSFLDHPKRPVSTLELLDRSARQQLLREWNDAAVAQVDDLCLHELVAAQTRRTPEALALVFEGEHFSYRHLASRVRRLAHQLQALGVGPECCVGLAFERGAEMVCALLAVLEAGGAFLPLDPSLPAERLSMMASDAQIPLLLTNVDAQEFLPDYRGKILKISTTEPCGELPTANAAGALKGSGPQHLAYVLFTSGTTGRPKGVMISHASLVNFLRAMARKPGLHGEDSLLAVTTLSFDISLLELLLPLLVGARVEVASRALAEDGRRLAQRLERSRTAAMQATPATWRMMLDVQWQPPPGFAVLCGGEALPADLAKSLAGGEARLWNLYGPTETTIWSATSEIPRNDAVTAGRAIDNTHLHILSRQLGVVPLGVVGELTIGGAGLTRGYLRRPALTAEKLIPNPQAQQPGERLYRTGDLARFHRDGRLEILGRIDHQVKVRGFRIELAEIEVALRDQEAVTDAAVVAREDLPGHLRLVAWVVPAEEDVLAVESLRQGLEARLPAYMIPSRFLPLQSLPLTSSGKVDRLALTRRDLPGSEADGGGSEPVTEKEKLLAGLWKELLGTSRVVLEDNFFELGGDSVLGVRLASRAAAAGLELTPLMLLENQTLGGLAAAAREMPSAVQEISSDEGKEPDPDQVVTEVSLDQSQLDKIFGKFG